MQDALPHIHLPTIATSIDAASISPNATVDDIHHDPHLSDPIVNDTSNEKSEHISDDATSGDYRRDGGWRAWSNVASGFLFSKSRLQMNVDSLLMLNVHSVAISLGHGTAFGVWQSHYKLSEFPTASDLVRLRNGFLTRFAANNFVEPVFHRIYRICYAHRGQFGIRSATRGFRA